ncbi:MAG: sigma-70 family RNA polymerase sigma factor [Ruminococcus sp.]|nr:sigma-70 family RNA polymerase sigma factor [Ruminococcus sp.]
MEDKKIIDLYFLRDQDAILHTQEKYGTYCYKIAFNILRNFEDSSECVNDTYIETWNCIPPHRPNLFSAFLAKITRRLSISKLRKNIAKKRGENTATCFDELNECIADKSEVYESIEVEELKYIIEKFLLKRSKDEMNIFICRYFYGDSIADISKQFNYSISKIKITLHRSRKALKEHLIKEGVFSE